MSPTQLYQELVLTSGAMTHRMDVLERTGLIERKSDPSDRRGILAVLTRDGRTLVERVMAAHLKHEAEIAAFLSCRTFVFCKANIAHFYFFTAICHCGL